MIPPSSGQVAELFPDLRNEPVRNFAETGWGRFPLPLIGAKLTPGAFAIYCHLSVAADTGEDLGVAKLAKRCQMTPGAALKAVDELKIRNMLGPSEETYLLTDPTEWKP